MATIQQRLAAALEAAGWELDTEAKTTKYIVYKPTADSYFVKLRTPPNRVDYNPMGARYFLGSAGGLRFSSRGLVSKAVSHEHAKPKLLARVP